MNNDVNAVISQIMSFQKQGKDPQAVMQMLMQRNPNYQQAMQRVKNMSQGKTPQEFVMQLARQNGVNQENLQAMQNMFGNK
jgi:DNA polymerase III gamma/tau subunit